MIFAQKSPRELQAKDEKRRSRKPHREGENKAAAWTPPGTVGGGECDVPAALSCDSVIGKMADGPQVPSSVGPSPSAAQLAPGRQREGPPRRSARISSHHSSLPRHALNGTTPIAGSVRPPAGTLDSFASWMRAHGVEWAETVLRMVSDDEGCSVAAGFGCVATAKINAGDELFCIPFAACFGASCEEADGGAAAEEDSQKEMARLYLQERAKGRHSSWAPLLSVQSSAPCPWVWPANARAWLQGTELADVVALKLQRLEAERVADRAGTGRKRAADDDGPPTASQYADACALVASHINPWYGSAIVPFNCMLNFARNPTLSSRRRWCSVSTASGGPSATLKRGRSSRRSMPTRRRSSSIVTALPLATACCSTRRRFRSPSLRWASRRLRLSVPLGPPSRLTRRRAVVSVRAHARAFSAPQLSLAHGLGTASKGRSPSRSNRAAEGPRS